MKIVARIEELLENLASQQAMPDSSWRETWADLRNELESKLAEEPVTTKHQVSLQEVRRKASPTGSVVVFFHGTSSTLRYNAGGANDGWWWEGRRIWSTEAELLLTGRVRAIVKS